MNPMFSVWRLKTSVFGKTTEHKKGLKPKAPVLPNILKHQAELGATVTIKTHST